MAATDDLRRAAAGLLNALASALRPRDTSRTPIPTRRPPSLSTPDDAPLAQLAKILLESEERSRKQTAELVLSILQGRPEAEGGPNGSTAPEQGLGTTLSVPNYDDDSIPLPGGIEAVLGREQAESETERLRLLRERDELAWQLAQANRQMPDAPDSPN